MRHQPPTVYGIDGDRNSGRTTLAVGLACELACREAGPIVLVPHPRTEHVRRAVARRMCDVGLGSEVLVVVDPESMRGLRPTYIVIDGDTCFNGMEANTVITCRRKN